MGQSHNCHFCTALDSFFVREQLYDSLYIYLFPSCHFNSDHLRMTYLGKHRRSVDLVSRNDCILRGILCMYTVHYCSKVSSRFYFLDADFHANLHFYGRAKEIEFK